MSSRFIPHSSMYQNAFLFKLAASGVLKTPQVILMMCHQGWDPLSFIQLLSYLSLPGWCSGKESTANARNSRNSRDKGSRPGSGRSREQDMATHSSIFFSPLQYFCLENSMDRGACGLQPVGLPRVRHSWVHTHFLTQMRKRRFRERKGPSLILSFSTYLLLIYHFPSKLGLRSSDVNSEKLHRSPYTPLSLCLKNFKLQ